MKQTKIFKGVPELAKEINDTLHLNLDFPIAVSGTTGYGKSTFVIHLGNEMSAMNGKKFDFNTNLCFRRSDVTQNIKKLAPQYSIISIDEAINNLYKRDFMIKEQNELIKLFQMSRFRNLSVAFVLPNIWSLDREILQSYIKMWIWIRRRGQATIFVPFLENPFSEDKWYKKENSKLVMNNKLHKSLNYAGEINFDKLTEEDEIKYLEIKKKKSLKMVGR